ncbi:MAG: acetate/propionate family kinase [Planctomycetaceae bacterium]|nr:acetate/propionate family kinase [Planctomycetaceae bacterium]
MALILVVNIGSTSLKYRLLDMADETTLARGYVERVGDSDSPFGYEAGEFKADKTLDTASGYSPAIAAMLAALTAPKDARPVPGVINDVSDIAGIGFKVVHGGYDLRGAYLLDDDVLETMESFSGVMPAHNPPYINAIRQFRQLLPGTPLVGAFETAFHAAIPEYAAVYGVPYEWREKYGVRRYGFHGASHRYLSERVEALMGKRLKDLKVITCHLGGSSSLAAVQYGKSIDTSMGFTTQSGVPMAKRSADIDPFLIPYVMEKEKLALDEVLSKMVKNGGLAGISGMSGDMRDLEDAYDRNPRARLAVDHFVHEVKKYIGAYMAVMNGLDALVFSGGIGENAVNVRARICADMGALGIKLDSARNAVQRREAEISPEGSRVRVWTIPTNEEIIVARETERVMG